MSVGFLGPMAGDRAMIDGRNNERRAESQEKADRAAGVGSADEQSDATSDRDADGRRPWERIRRPVRGDAEAESKSIDVSGKVGNSLDISG